MNLISIQNKRSENFQENLKHIESIIQEAPKNAFLLAPELSLSGYAYEHLDDAVDISNKAIESFLALSVDKTIALTLTTKKDGNYYNTFYIFHQGEIVHTQSKVKLFEMNDEGKYFTVGNEADIHLFEINGLKVGVMICFELRFIDLWQKLRGADIILVPAMWGAKRKGNFEILTQALAVANQCFVIAANSGNEECNGGSAVISPFGCTTRDDTQETLSLEIDLTEIAKMRKFLDVGIV